MRKLWILLALCLIPFVCSFSNDNIKIYTEDQPPLNFYHNEENKVTGFSTEIVEEILNRIGSDSEIEMKSWVRAYTDLTHEKDVFLFSMARIPVREDLFKWIGPIAMKKAQFYAKKESGFSGYTIEDIKSSLKIGVKRKNSKEQYLIDRGYFNNLYSATTWEQILKMLLSGRVDCMLYSDIDFPELVKRLEVDISQFEVIHEFYDYPLYIGVSKSTSDATVLQWQNTLDEIKKDGFFEMKIKQWGAHSSNNWVYINGMLQIIGNG